MALSSRLQQLNRIIDQIKQDQLPMKFSRVYAFGPFAAGDEDAPVQLVLEPDVTHEKLTSAMAWKRLQDTHAMLVRQEPDLQVIFDDEALAYFHANNIEFYLEVWAFGDFCLWDQETHFGYPHADKRLFDFMGLVDPNCFDFTAKAYALCRQFVSDGTLCVESSREMPEWEFTPRQAALLAQPRFVESLTNDRECLVAALTWISGEVFEDQVEALYWFRPGIIDSANGSTRLRYGLVPLKEILHDFASNPKLEKCITVSPTANGPRKIHIFTADEGLTSGGMLFYHDRLQILETRARFGEVL